MRRAAQVDRGQGPIVEALRKAGATVVSLAAVGKGVPDLLVGWKGTNFLLEVKQAPARGKVRASEDGCKLSPTQVAWTVTWRGQVALVRSIEDAMAVIGLLTR